MIHDKLLFPRKAAGLVWCCDRARVINECASVALAAVSTLAGLEWKAFRKQRLESFRFHKLPFSANRARILDDNAPPVGWLLFDAS